MKIIKIILASLLVSALLYHGSLWFLKTRVIKNYIEQGIANEKEHLSAVSVNLAITPFFQKIIIKNIVVKEKNLEATFEEIAIHPTLFSNAYVVQFPNKIHLKTDLNPKISSLEFSGDSKFTFTSDFKLENFSLKYNGSGFKVGDKDGKRLSEIQSKDAQIEIGLGKEIFYRSKSSYLKIIDANDNIVISKGPTNIYINTTSKDSQEYAAKANINIQDLEFFGLKNQNPAQTQEQAPSFQSLAYKDFNSGKTSLIFAGEIGVKFDNQNNEANKKNDVPSHIALEIENFEFLHQKYKILLNGNIHYQPATLPLPYGAITLQIENLDNIFELILAAKKQESDLNDLKIDEALNNMRQLSEFIKEVAARNSKTTPSKLVFDINKNKDEFEFKINGSGFAELMLEYVMKQASKSLDPANLPAIDAKAF